MFVDAPHAPFKGLTPTVTELPLEPPVPLHEIANAVLAVSAPELKLPDVPLLNAPPSLVTVHELAFDDDHVMVDALP